MPRRRDERDRVIGPTWLPSNQYWRVVVITPGAAQPSERRLARYYREEDEANEAAVAARTLIERNVTLTVGDAIDAYEHHLEESGTIGYRETVRRLRVFYPELKMTLGRLTPDKGKAYYSAFRQRKRPDKKPISVAYHRAALINARSLLKWCIAQGWMDRNPLAGIEGVGKRKSGKRKPTADELRKLYVYSWPRVEAGDLAALGVWMVFAMALRSSDLTRRVVRDADADATQLNIHDGKSEKSNEPRIVPDVFQPHLRKLITGRDPFAPLFYTPITKDGHHTRRWLEEAMVRLCEGAGIPYVCPHALKGASGTVLAKRGAAGNLIMDHLSHEDEVTTFKHYVDRGLVDQAQSGQAFKIIAGGKR